MKTTQLNDKKYCIWMEAGVIDYKLCDHNYDCNTCKFDQAMRLTAEANMALLRAGKQPKGKKGKIIPWQEKMRQRSGVQQLCRHMLTKRVPAYFCGNNYNCSRCPFDQFLEDQLELQTPTVKPQLQEVFGVKVPVNAYLHQGHAWVIPENAGRLRLGLDDFSQKVFGPADEFKLPKIGQTCSQNGIGLALARQGRKAAVLAPVDGIIEAVNPEVRKHPRVVHDYPYEDGWLLVITPTNLKPNLENLLFGEKNVAWINFETHRLLEMLQSTAGVTLPDGGALVDDVFGHFPQLDWRKLAREFLRTE